VAEKVPPSPPVARKAAPAPAPARSERAPDYAGVFRRFGGAERPPLASLAGALEEKDAGVRRAALETVVGMDRGKPFALALLSKALHDPGAREWAIDRLRALGPDATPAVPALVVELGWAQKQGHFLLTYALTRALGHIGPGAAEAIPSLRELFAGRKGPGNVDYEVEAARSLGRIGPRALSAAPELLDLLLKYPGGYQNAAVARALERVGAGAAEALVPPLIEALRPVPVNPNSRYPFDPRTSVVDLLDKLGPRAKAAAPKLRALMNPPSPGKDPPGPFRAAVAEALWHVEGNDMEALAVLMAILTEKAGDERGRTRAAQALGRIGAPARSAVPALTDRFRNGPTPSDHLEAAEALWCVTGDARPVLPYLIDVLREKPRETDWQGFTPATRDSGAQVRAIAVLSRPGPAAKEAAPELAAAIRAEDAFNARQKGRVRLYPHDEEDEDPDTSEIIRRTGLPVLQRLDPVAARALALPAPAP
jgi:hypothetical protein